MKVDLKELPRTKKLKGAVKLPPIQVGSSVERSYLAQFRKAYKQVAKEIRESTIEAYKNEQDRQKLEDVVFDIRASWFEAMGATITGAFQQIEDVLAGIFEKEGRRHTKTFMLGAKRAFGIDLASILTQEDLNGLMEEANYRNVSLIKGLAAETRKRLEQTVIRNFQAGNSVSALRKALKDDFGFLDKRARLIARDQAAKLTGDLNKFRQQQVGGEEYEWSDSDDSRVRPDHAEADGKIFRWDQPTSINSGNHPTEDINCRCVAVAVFRF